MKEEIAERLPISEAFEECLCCQNVFHRPNVLCQRSDLTEALCVCCRRHVPPSLAKACIDEFYYTLRLSTGETIRFQSAEIYGDYVHLELSDADGCDINKRLPYSFARGIDVRLDAIVWCADAPEGS
jgi:hypothetical protein